MTTLVKNSSNDGWSGSVSRSLSNMLLVPVLSSVASPRPKRDTEAEINKMDPSPISLGLVECRSVVDIEHIILSYEISNRGRATSVATE